jgi:hypothetical protein
MAVNSISKYSRILIIQFAQHQIGTKILNIPDFRWSLYWPKFLQVIFVTATILLRGVLQLDIFFLCWFRVLIWVFWSLHRWWSS